MRRVTVLTVGVLAAVGAAAFAYSRLRARGSEALTPEEDSLFTVYTPGGRYGFLANGPVGWALARLGPMVEGGVYDTIAEMLDLQPDDELLDIGCGSGAFLAAKARGTRRVVGLDPSRTMLRTAERRLTGRLKKETARLVTGSTRPSSPSMTASFRQSQPSSPPSTSPRRSGCCVPAGVAPWPTTTLGNRRASRPVAMGAGGGPRLSTGGCSQTLVSRTRPSATRATTRSSGSASLPNRPTPHAQLPCWSAVLLLRRSEQYPGRRPRAAAGPRVYATVFPGPCCPTPPLVTQGCPGVGQALAVGAEWLGHVRSFGVM